MSIWKHGFKDWNNKKNRISGCLIRFNQLVFFKWFNNTWHHVPLLLLFLKKNITSSTENNNRFDQRFFFFLLGTRADSQGHQITKYMAGSPWVWYYIWLMATKTSQNAYAEILEADWNVDLWISSILLLLLLLSKCDK